MPQELDPKEAPEEREDDSELTSEDVEDVAGGVIKPEC